jgi:DNA-3-methyladenine glycosylase II
MRRAITHLKNADPVLARIIDEVGPYRIQFRDPDFETLVRSIVFQQLSGKVARVIFDRLRKTSRCRGPLKPRAILRLSEQEMRAAGLSGQKMNYIRDLAERTASGELDFGNFPELPDEQVIEQLTQVKGIGVWTVQMFLMFALQRVNVLPIADLGIRVAVKKAYELPDLPKPAEVARLGQCWHPYCTVASWYLWRSLETEAGL